MQVECTRDNDGRANHDQLHVLSAWAHQFIEEMDLYTSARRTSSFDVVLLTMHTPYRPTISRIAVSKLKTLLERGGMQTGLISRHGFANYNSGRAGLGWSSLIEDLLLLHYLQPFKMGGKSIFSHTTMSIEFDEKSTVEWNRRASIREKLSRFQAAQFRI
jgi:hypothetical protein